MVKSINEPGTPSVEETVDPKAGAAKPAPKAKDDNGDDDDDDKKPAAKRR